MSQFVSHLVSKIEQILPMTEALSSRIPKRLHFPLSPACHGNLSDERNFRRRNYRGDRIISPGAS